MYYDLVESGKRIKALRKKNGLTQEKLAEQLGIAVNTVARIEIGNRGISIDLAIELAVRFNTTLLCREIIRRLIANQFHRGLTSAGFSASSVEKYL